MSEIRAALDGSWLLFRNRPEGMAFFDQSIQGFWRSFLVVFLLVPVFLFGGLAEKRLFIAYNLDQLASFPDRSYWTAQFLGLAVDWITLPVLLALLAVPIGISQRYVPFIVVRNWTSLLVSMPYLVLYLLYLIGIFSGEVTVLLSLVYLPVILWYNYIIARIALQATVSVAIGVVVLDVVLTLLIDTAVGHLWQ